MENQSCIRKAVEPHVYVSILHNGDSYTRIESPTYEEHVNDLREAMKICHDQGIKLLRDKCVLMKYVQTGDFYFQSMERKVDYGQIQNLLA